MATFFHFLRFSRTVRAAIGFDGSRSTRITRVWTVMIGLSSSRIFSLTSLPTGGSVSRLTRVLFSPIFSVWPPTLIFSPLSASIQLASTGMLARIRWCSGDLYDDVAYSTLLSAIYIPSLLYISLSRARPDQKD